MQKKEGKREQNNCGPAVILIENKGFIIKKSLKKDKSKRRKTIQKDKVDCQNSLVFQPKKRLKKRLYGQKKRAKTKVFLLFFILKILCLFLF